MESALCKAMERGILVKRPENALYCNVCSVEMKGEIPAEAHLKGKTHTKRLKMCNSNFANDGAFQPVKKQKENTEDVDDLIAKGLANGEIADSGGILTCQVCLINVTGIVPMGQHLISNAHKKKQSLRNGHWEPRGPSPVRESIPSVQTISSSTELRNRSSLVRKSTSPVQTIYSLTEFRNSSSPVRKSTPPVQTSSSSTGFIGADIIIIHTDEPIPDPLFQVVKP